MYGRAAFRYMYIRASHRYILFRGTMLEATEHKYQGAEQLPFWLAKDVGCTCRMWSQNAMVQGISSSLLLEMPGTVPRAYGAPGTPVQQSSKGYMRAMPV